MAINQHQQHSGLHFPQHDRGSCPYHTALENHSGFHSTLLRLQSHTIPLDLSSLASLRLASASGEHAESEAEGAWLALFAYQIRSLDSYNKLGPPERIL